MEEFSEECGEGYGQRIKQIRAFNNETQEKFAANLRVDRGYIGKIETERSKPSSILIRLICLAYGINEKWLVLGEGEMKSAEIPSQGIKKFLINKPLLQSIIEITEERASDISSDKKAEIISLIYEYYAVQGGNPEHDKEGILHTVLRYLTLLGGEAKEPKPNKGKTIPFPQKISMKGNDNIGNVGIAGDNKGMIGGKNNIMADKVTIKTLKKKINISPPSDSIGNDSHLKETIQALFNRLGEARENTFGKQAYPVMYNNFKKDFGIKNNPWTIIWTWHKSCAPAIIDYLNKKYDNTRPGRLERASKREDYIQTRPALFEREKNLLSHFGLETDSPEVKGLLYDFFAVTSHKHLTHLQHWQFVQYLEAAVNQQYGEG
ncbi:MAG: helix-turn-helix transcriptional regulator [Desulfobacteraceae bacterium]|nr:helix-turn-helix transcriptional regulator [Desulfobacteraceae bacterium]